jgi:hypothetical protein
MCTVILQVRALTPTKLASWMARSLLAGLVTVLVGAAQPSAPLYTSPPVWPGEPALASQPPDRYVFVSPDHDVIIVRVPADWARSHGKPQVIRYEIHNRLRPSVLVRMSAGSPRGYEYNYTIRNAGDAQDVIQNWSVIIPAGRSGREEPQISGSDQWNGGHSYPPIMRQVEMPDQPLGRVVVWVQDETDRMLTAGASQAGFRIESPCRPGFTTALFDSGMFPNIDQELPDEVFRQLAFYNDPTWRSVPALTFGPMFCGETPQREIVRNMTSGIKRSIETGLVKSTSQFAREALEQLNSIRQNEGGVMPVLSLPPSGGFEEEIFKALQLSLRFSIAVH